MSMVIKKGEEILLISEDGKKYLVNADKKLFSTNLGAVDLSQLIGKSFGAKIKSNKKYNFYVLQPDFSDILFKFKRGPQVVLQKDAGPIITYSGVGYGQKVVDAGTGSGWLAAQLANVVGPTGKVITYEYRKEFFETAKNNFKKLGLKNIKLIKGNAYKDIKEKNADLLTLDLPEPWKVKNINKIVRVGGRVVAYLPQVTQFVDFTTHVVKKGFRIERVVEFLEREWSVSHPVVRPKSQMLGHTAFLVFARRIEK